MKRLFVLFIVACLLALPLSGCNFQFDLNDNADSGDIQDPSDDGDTTEPGDSDDDTVNPGDDGNSQKILDGNAFYPADYIDVLAKYKEFGYEWTTSNSTQTDTTYFHYLYEGSEDVDGVAAEVYTVIHEQPAATKVEKQWYNSDWECIKVMVDGQVMPWSEITMPNHVEHYVSLVKNAQWVFDEEGCINTLAYSLEEEGSGTQGSPVGSMEVYVLNSLDLPSSYSYGMTEIDGELIFALIRQGYTNSQDYEELRVTELVAK